MMRAFHFLPGVDPQTVTHKCVTHNVGIRYAFIYLDKFVAGVEGEDPQVPVVYLWSCYIRWACKVQNLQCDLPPRHCMYDCDEVDTLAVQH